MGKRGPVPKKTALKVLSGNLPLREKFLGDALTKKFDPPEIPAHLSVDEKSIWNKTLALLRPLKFIENIDGAILGAFCCSYARWMEAEQLIQKERRRSKRRGLLAPGASGGLVINPLVTISRRSQADMVNYAAQLGMTPAARLRIQAEGPDPDDNPFEKLRDG